MKTIGIYLERKPDSGGAYQYCLAMLKALSSFPLDRYQIVAFCTYEEWNKELEKLGIKGFSVKKNFIQKVAHKCMSIFLPTVLYRKSSKWIHPLAKALVDNDIDICIFPCGDTIAAYMDVISVCTIFDLMHRYLKDFSEICDKKVYKSRERNYKNICKYSTLILVDSEEGKRQLVECYGEYLNAAANIRVLPYIAPDYIYNNLNKRLKEKMELPEKYIFYPAQFWSHKNHKNLLLAVSRLRQRGLYINLLFSGAPKNSYSLVKDIIEKESLGKQVIILDYVKNEEVIELYNRARAMVMPTFAGPTNIPQLEAFLLECPVATSNIFAISDQVGDAALLFNPNSVEEIADCVERLWLDDELCRDLIRKGRMQAAKWGQKEFSQALLRYIMDVEKY